MNTGDQATIRLPQQRAIEEGMPKANDKAIPRIKATPIYEDGRLTQFKFYCPYCRAWHCHGAPLGARRAHCWNPRSPYLVGGYVLEEATED